MLKNQAYPTEFRANCINNKVGQMIDRSENADLISANKQRLDKLKAICRRQQAIVEHPYGIIKRQWGFKYIMTKRTMKFERRLLDRLPLGT